MCLFSGWKGRAENFNTEGIKEFTSQIRKKRNGTSLEVSTPVFTLLPGTLHTPETLFSHQPRKYLSSRSYLYRQPSGAEGMWPAAKANSLDQKQKRRREVHSQSRGQVIMFTLWFEGLGTDSIWKTLNRHPHPHPPSSLGENKESDGYHCLISICQEHLR